MNVRSSSLIVACAVILSAASPSPARAQGQPVGNKTQALQLYEKGKIQYDLGRWKQAVDLWTQAYETYNAPEFLFNIGQAYRHEGDCEQSLFFYRRYLATKPNARNRGEVEGFIKDLEGRCKQPASGKPPGQEGEPAGPKVTGPGPTDPTAKGPGPEGGPEPDEAIEDETDPEGYDESVETASDRPGLFAMRVAIGPSFPSIGNLEVGTLVSLALGVGHPLYVGPVVIEPGAMVTYTPIPWEVVVDDMNVSDTAAMTGILGNVGLNYPVLPKLSIRAEAGAGVMVFTGLTVDQNPFLAMGENATGPISMFEARGALGVEFAITKNFVIHAQPAVFTYSPTPPLRREIQSITRFEMLVGAGYAM
jgi:hypothetical protein